MNIYNQYNNFNFYHMKKLFTLVSMALACILQCNAGDFSNWGKLQVVGNQLCSSTGEAVQLKGWSTFGRFDNLQRCFDEQKDFEEMKNNGANVARIAMYIKEGDGYESNPNGNKQWVKSCMDYCHSLNMYCIVDWHILKPGDPNSYNGAEQFFQEICQYARQKNYDNVIYEICNEPNDDTPTDVCGPIVKNVWEQVKTYAAKVLPVIKQNDGDAVVLVGTPQWDQGLTWQMMDPVDTYGLPNVMYSFHHYAGDQERYLGYLSSAAAYLPIFVSEWGLSSHTGDGGDINKAKQTGQMMLDICNGKNLGKQLISWINWSWCDKGEVASAFQYYNDQNPSQSQWSQSGEFIKSAMKDNSNYVNILSEPYDEPQVFNGFDDLELNLMKYDKGGFGIAFHDNDNDWLDKCRDACNMGNAGFLDGIRDDETVDLGYTNLDDNGNERNPGETNYICLGYISQSEWVNYAMDIKIAGIYEFEIYTCNKQAKEASHNEAINKVAFAVDGKNALVEADGSAKHLAVNLTPCHGGSYDDSNAYNDWGWAEVTSDYAKGTKFYLNLPEGKHTFSVAFMATSAGLGTVKFKGKPENEEAWQAILANAEKVACEHKASVWQSAASEVSVLVDANAAVSICALDGSVVYEGEALANQEVKVSLAKGVYVASIKSENGTSTEKLIVK